MGRPGEVGRVEVLVSLGSEACSRCIPGFCLQCVFFQAWLNEKFAPELLESKPEIIECVVEQLDHMVGSAGLRWWCRQAAVTWPGKCVLGDCQDCLLFCPWDEAVLSTFFKLVLERGLEETREQCALCHQKQLQSGFVGSMYKIHLSLCFLLFDISAI